MLLRFLFMVDLKKAEKSILKNFFKYCYPVPYPAIFGGYLVVQLESLERGGRCSPPQWGPGKETLFCILNSSKHCSYGSATTNGDNLSIFRWINFYTFESLGVSVWNSKSVYQLQNSSGYGTATKLEFWQTLNMSFLFSLANLA